jgi:hypothetical protein
LAFPAPGKLFNSFNKSEMAGSFLLTAKKDQRPRSLDEELDGWKHPHNN